MCIPVVTSYLGTGGSSGSTYPVIQNESVCQNVMIWFLKVNSIITACYSLSSTKDVKTHIFLLLLSLYLNSWSSILRLLDIYKC